MNTITDIMTLRYAVRLAETGGFRRAAEECHVTQPTISIQVRRLEESLGYPLFERTSRGVYLTPEGEKFIAHARELVMAWERLLTPQGDAARDLLGGMLSLGVIPTLGPYLIPALHGLLSKEAPALRLNYLEEQTALLLHRLLKGQIDCAVIALPVEDDNLTVFELADDPFVVVTRKTRRPGALKSPLGPADLPREGLLLLTDGHCFRGQALAVCGMRPGAQLRVEGSSFATLLNLIEVDAAAAYTLLPLTAQSELAFRPGLKILKFAPPAPSRRLGLALRKSSPWLAAAPFLTEWIGEAVQELLKRR